MSAQAVTTRGNAPPRPSRRRRWLEAVLPDPLSDGLALERPLIAAITDREPDLKFLSDVEIRARADALQRRARGGEPLDDLLVESFSLAREAARRALGERPYDVQIAGGIAIHRGRVGEMQTGEGKTLTAVAPLFLNALTGRGAHVLTFNDYLARRDAGWMGPVYERLGVRVGVVQEGMTAAERRRAYRCDVTYVTAKEAGFDLLRDGLCLEPGEQVHRPFYFALVDEADSILIDEARVPLVIAGGGDDDHGALPRLPSVVRRLDPTDDFATDEYGHTIFLTERGCERVEAALGCGSLFVDEHVTLLAAVRNALHAEHLLRRDVDYIVRDGVVELVDQFTGRVAENRHWPDGLQAAVEAKEGLRLGEDGRILGSITLQHFLSLYPRLAGMTATATSAAEELSDVYGLEVVVIPTHRPGRRDDRPDVIYARREARDAAVLEEIVAVNASGRPVLVGTANIADSERLAAALRERAVPCSVLNAKCDAREAEIVAEAGALRAVTISTNMAGRGTDIRLGGRDEGERDAVVALGGLYVIGTNRHESVRIDRQLRGRAGRQGDPGSSQFFVSLEDELLQRYGIDRFIPDGLVPALTDGALDSPVVGREVARVQRIVEGECGDLRRRLYRYSDVIERQRHEIAEWRQAVLEGYGLGMLAERAGARWRRLADEVGVDVLRQVEQRLTVLMIDRCWSEYLTEMQAVRDEIHLVALDGREPLVEFSRTAIAAFERLLEHVDESIVEAFSRLEITAGGVDWERLGLRGPVATWTYTIDDSAFSNNVLRTLANHASIGLWATLLWWPLLFLWGLYLHWRRRHVGDG